MKFSLFLLLLLLCYDIQTQTTVENKKEQIVNEKEATENKKETTVNTKKTNVNETLTTVTEEATTAIPVLDVATRMSMFNREGFAQLLIKARLFEILYQHEKPYTLFTPNNDIVGNFTKKTTNYAEIRRFAEYHIYQGSYEALDFQDGQSVTSYDNHKAYLNRLYSKVKKRMRIWIQGVEVETTVAKSGKSVIHLINGYIEKPTESLFQYLERSGGYNIVMKVFRKYKLYFQFPYGVTFLAPLDKAFDNLPSKYREELFKDDVKIRMLLRNHIISRPMCRSRLFHIVGWSRVINNVGNTLHLYQDLFNKDASYVNGAAVVTSQAVTNGWTYGISDLLLPEINRKLLEELRFRDCHTFLQHLISTGHMQKLSNLLEIRTVFAPTDKAFEKLPNATKVRMSTDKDFHQRLISYHVAFGKHLVENLLKQKSIETAAKDTSGNESIRLHFGNELGRVERSRIIDGDRFALNGIIHIIDRVLIPPETSTIAIIESEKNLRIFKKYYKQLNSKFKEMLNNQVQGYSFLIPSNGALKTYFQLLNVNNEEEAIQRFNQVIWRHVVPTLFWIKRSPGKVVSKQLNTMYKNNATGKYDVIDVMIPRKKTKDHIRIPEYNAKLLTWNQLTYNGTLHIVDRVFAGELKNVSDERDLKFNKKTWKKLQARWAKNKIKLTTSQESTTNTKENKTTEMKNNATIATEMENNATTTTEMKINATASNNNVTIRPTSKENNNNITKERKTDENDSRITVKEEGTTTKETSTKDIKGSAKKSKTTTKETRITAKKNNATAKKSTTLPTKKVIFKTTTKKEGAVVSTEKMTTASLIEKKN